LEPPNSLTDDYFSQGIALILILFSYALLKRSEYIYSLVTGSDRDDLKADERRKARLLLRLLSNNEHVAVAVIQAETFLATATIILVYVISLNIFHSPAGSVFWKASFVLIISILILGLSAMLIYRPVAGNSYLKKAKNLGPFFSIVLFIALPVNKLFQGLNRLFSGTVEEKNAQSIEEITEINDESDHEEVEEKRLLKGIVELPNKSVSLIMKPRVEIVSVDMNMSSSQVVERAMECGFSRMPVYGSTPDDVKGFLYIKDLVKYLRDNIKEFDWHKHIRKVSFVPGSKKINSLLEEFRQKKIHIAMVVDEYGGTDGIVTLEDILEEIVGEISDETDITE